MVFICPGFLNHPFRLSLSKPGRLGLFADLESLPVRSAGAGLSPRQATHFSLLRQRKVSKRKATPSLRPLRGAKGQTCGGAVAGCAAELTSLLCSSVRTTAASQSTKHGRSGAHATPQAPRRRRSQQGFGQPDIQQPNSHTGHCFARPLRGRKRHALRKPGRAQRWPEWMSDSRVPFRMRRGAQRPADQGSRLSERSETERVRARPRWTRAPQVARSEAKGRSVQGRPFFGSFLSATRKKGTRPPGRTPGFRPVRKHAAVQTPSPASTCSARTVSENYQKHSC